MFIEGEAIAVVLQVTRDPVQLVVVESDTGEVKSIDPQTMAIEIIGDTIDASQYSVEKVIEAATSTGISGNEKAKFQHEIEVKIMERFPANGNYQLEWDRVVGRDLWIMNIRDHGSQRYIWNYEKQRFVRLLPDLE